MYIISCRWVEMLEEIPTHLYPGLVSLSVSVLYCALVLLLLLGSAAEEVHL